jgi:hypothetical protein
VIVEERSYHIHTGKVPEYLRLYEHEGMAIQVEILGHMIGYFTVDIGEPSTVVHLWAYESYAERERRRAELAAHPGWQEYVLKVQPLIHTQTNRILVPTPFSPLR